MSGKSRAAGSAPKASHNARSGAHGRQRRFAVGRRQLIPPQGLPEAPAGTGLALGRIEPCAICSREARGFVYCHLLNWDRFPAYRFCSLICLDIGTALAGENFGVIDKTERERQAIKDARRNLAETLTELGLMQPFFKRSADDIDRIIETCVDGFRESMTKQNFPKADVLDDSIPF